MANQVMNDFTIQAQNRPQTLKHGQKLPMVLLEDDQLMSLYCVSASEDQVSSVPYAEYFAYQLAGVLSRTLNLGPLQDFRVYVRQMPDQ